MNTSPIVFQTAVFRKESTQAMPAVAISVISVSTDGQEDVSGVIERSLVVNADNLNVVVDLAQVAGTTIDKIRSVLVFYRKSVPTSGNLAQPNTLSQPLKFRVNVAGTHLVTTSVFQLTSCDSLQSQMTFSHFEDPTADGGVGMIGMVITTDS